MTTKKKTSKKKTQAIRMASVEEMMAQGVPHEPEQNEVVTIRATRTFDQMVRGETAVVDPEETYWSDNIRGGNLEVIE